MTQEAEKNQQGKQCFVISRIGKAGTEQWSESKNVLDFIIKPVLEGRGYSVVRADDSRDPNILQDILNRLVDADIVVADLTDNNANVFYELGVRHSTGKATILLNKKGSSAPFDVLHTRYVAYALEDLKQVEEAKTELSLSLDWCEENKSAPQGPLTPLNISSYLGKALSSSGDKS